MFVTNAEEQGKGFCLKIPRFKVKEINRSNKIHNYIKAIA